MLQCPSINAILSLIYLYIDLFRILIYVCYHLYIFIEQFERFIKERLPYLN